jgi:hypothetical protein
MIAFIQQNYPESLPKTRSLVDSADKAFSAAGISSGETV